MRSCNEVVNRTEKGCSSEKENWTNKESHMFIWDKEGTIFFGKRTEVWRKEVIEHGLKTQKKTEFWGI